MAFAFFANAQIGLNLELVASGFDEPVDISNAGDDRLFITEQDGTIRIVKDGVVMASPFLDIDSQVNSGANERGLLGLAFHPDYANNGYFYVNYNNSSGTTIISRFSVAQNPDTADPNSELILMSIPQPFSNHNGGELEFGPDGYLYIGTGDGGAGGDPGNRSQNPQVLLGKMLRIDVDNPSNGENYGIPADNPFVGDASTLDEIWALGLRNPWKYTFDRATGDLWIADVGQNEWEEIDVQPANSTGGENYGWRCREGMHNYDTSSGCPPLSELTEPIHEYVNTFSEGCSVTGGYVYRGCDYPGMVGAYIYADYCSGKFWSITTDGNGNYVNEELANLSNNQYSSFGEDIDGELYVVAHGQGAIYKVTDTNSTTTTVSIEDAGDNLLQTSIENVNYQWLLDGQPIAGATEATYQATVTGEYTLMVNTANDCTFESNTIELIISSVESINGLETMTIAPNPLSNETSIYLKTSKQMDLTIRLIDGSGKVLTVNQATVNGNLTHTFDMVSYASGIYFIQIGHEGNMVTKSVMKQ